MRSGPLKAGLVSIVGEYESTAMSRRWSGWSSIARGGQRTDRGIGASIGWNPGSRARPARAALACLAAALLALPSAAAAHDLGIARALLEEMSEGRYALEVETPIGLSSEEWATIREMQAKVPAFVAAGGSLARLPQSR